MLMKMPRSGLMPLLTSVPMSMRVRRHGVQDKDGRAGEVFIRLGKAYTGGGPASRRRMFLTGVWLCAQTLLPTRKSSRKRWDARSDQSHHP